MKDYNKETVETADSIEELATMVCGYGYFAYHNDDRDYPVRKEAVQEYLEMGAAFAKKMMMKDAVEGLVVCDELTHGYKDIAMSIPDYLNVGDKVKMIIIKED